MARHDVAGEAMSEKSGAHLERNAEIFEPSCEGVAEIMEMQIDDLCFTR